MAPKIKITKENIINAAFDLTRKNGATTINARTLATYLNCSTQPIFSNFATMDDLRIAVLQRADELYSQYLAREIAEQKFPPYKATGIAYIRFAKDEKELFKLLFMRDRTDENTIVTSQSDSLVKKVLHESTGLNGSEALLFHLKMWMCVHGIATMVATGYFELDWDTISNLISDVYKGAKLQYETE